MPVSGTPLSKFPYTEILMVSIRMERHLSVHRSMFCPTLAKNVSIIYPNFDLIFIIFKSIYKEYPAVIIPK